MPTEDDKSVKSNEMPSIVGAPITDEKDGVELAKHHTALKVFSSRFEFVLGSKRIAGQMGADRLRDLDNLLNIRDYRLKRIDDCYDGLIESFAKAKQYIEKHPTTSEDVQKLYAEIQEAGKHAEAANVIMVKYQPEYFVKRDVEVAENIRFTQEQSADFYQNYSEAKNGLKEFTKLLKDNEAFFLKKAEEAENALVFYHIKQANEALSWINLPEDDVRKPELERIKSSMKKANNIVQDIKDGLEKEKNGTKMIQDNLFLLFPETPPVLKPIISLLDNDMSQALARFGQVKNEVAAGSANTLPDARPLLRDDSIGIC